MPQSKAIAKRTAAALVSLLFVLLGSGGAAAQQADSSRLLLRAEAMHFFQNNEYFNPRQAGYTLPGFYLRPRIVWHLGKGASMEVGLHMLHYWGGTTYPSGRIGEPWGEMPDSTGLRCHVLPWMRADLDLGQHLRLTLGHLHSEHGHLLPLPLFNPERHYASDPEAGVQLQGHWKGFDIEVWSDWQEYIWHRSTRQERFLAGLTAIGNLCLSDGWRLTLPLHLLALHNGGQDLAVPLTVNTQYNMAAGLGGAKQAGRWCVEARCYAMAYMQQRCVVVPFDRGYGLYPTLRADYDGALLLEVGYWHSRQFVPLMGSRLFGNLPAVDGDSAPTHSRMLTAGVRYRWEKIKAVVLEAEGHYYHYFGEAHPQQYAIGLTVGIQPTLSLLR